MVMILGSGRTRLKFSESDIPSNGIAIELVLWIRLPHAPSMKMYCVYGVGKETERSYW